MTKSIAHAVQKTLKKSLRSLAGSRRAVMFSGGFDSMLMALLAQRCGARVTAVTVRFDDFNPLTVAEASLLARKMGLDHHILHVTLPEFLSAFGSVATLLSKPLLDPDLALVHAAFKKYNPHIAGRIFISGMGSDQWFGDGLQEQAAIDEQAHHKVARAHGYRFIFPFLSKPMRALSRQVPADLKKDKKLLRELVTRADTDMLLARGVAREIQVPAQVRRLLAKVYGRRAKADE